MGFVGILLGMFAMGVMQLILAVGTLYGGLAPNMIHLIIARTILGLGAGIITPASLAMISDIFPPEKRGRMIGIFGFVQLLSNILTPSLGGFITKQLGWHWIFFIVLIVTVFSMLLVAIGNKDQRISSLVGVSKIDIQGGLPLGKVLAPE